MMTRLLFLLLAGTALAGCQEMLRPKVTPVGDQMAKAGEIVEPPVTIPLPPHPAAGSLWVPGNKQFFKDSRAHAVGDIVTVVVAESASASSSGKTNESRAHTQQAGILGIPWLTSHLPGMARGIAMNGTNLADTSSNRAFTGSGDTARTDTLTANIAAVVTQVLPNGLLVIQGQREVLMNYEKQTLILKGIIRPEDITSGNTIPSSQVAEARISYTGNGTVDENQTPQYGVKMLDKVLPF